MKFTKHTFIALALILGVQTALAQQEILYTQYVFTGLAINPAYAGSHDALSLNAISRHQWAGLEGAPTTQTFSAHTPIPERNIAVGAMFSRDAIGITSINTVQGVYAYRIQTGAGTLSFGLQGGFTMYADDYGKLTGIGTDPSVSEGAVQEMQPNFGAGLYFRNDKFFVGASIPKLINHRLAENSGFQQTHHIFLNAGGIITLNPSLKLKPNLLVKVIESAPVQVDAGSYILLKEIIWLGASVRFKNSINYLAALQLSKQFQLGYAYDSPINEINLISSGSHEIMLTYTFFYKKKNLIHPRYF